MYLYWKNTSLGPSMHVVHIVSSNTVRDAGDLPLMASLSSFMTISEQRADNSGRQSDRLGRSAQLHEGAMTYHAQCPKRLCINGSGIRRSRDPYRRESKPRALGVSVATLAKWSAALSHQLPNHSPQ